MTTIAPPPADTSDAPPPATPGGRTAVRVGLTVAATVLVVGSVVALAVAAFGLSTFRVLADEEALPGDIRSLVIDTGEVPAAVTLRTDREASEPRVSLRLVSNVKSNDQALAVNRDSDGATVTVRGTTPELADWARTGRVVVTLPPAMARDLSVTVRQQTGVLFADAYVDELVAHGYDGAVVLNGGARRVEVHNVDGSVVSREPVSVMESFIADTEDGDIVIDFADAAPEVVEATTTDGDVVLEVPGAGPYLVTTSSSRSATVQVPQTKDPDQAVADITARSDDGTVTITTPGARGAHSERWDR